MTVTDGDIDGQGDLIRPTAIDRAGRGGGPRQAAAHTEPGMLQGLRGTGRRAWHLKAAKLKPESRYQAPGGPALLSPRNRASRSAPRSGCPAWVLHWPDGRAGGWRRRPEHDWGAAAPAGAAAAALAAIAACRPECGQSTCQYSRSTQQATRRHVVTSSSAVVTRSNT